MVCVLARVVGIGIETADILVQRLVMLNRKGSPGASLDRNHTKQGKLIAERMLKMPKEPRFDTDRSFREVPKNGHRRRL